MKTGPVVNVYVWNNGMVMAFNSKGYQVPEYQGRREDVLDKIKRDFPDAVIKGEDEGLQWA